VSTRTLYRLAYYSTPERRDREVLIHQLRDGDAALELAEVMRGRGYRYGGLLLNYPGKPDALPRKLAISFKSTDLLMLTSRPPMHDEADQDRRRIAPSRTDLEDKVFESLRRYFKHCSRTEITLADDLVLKKELSSYRSVTFREYHEAYCLEYTGSKPSRHDRRTLSYITYTPHVWPGGPGLLCAFGMGGPETLITNFLIRTKPDLRRCIMAYQFVMIELHEQEIILPQDSLALASKWQYKILTRLLPTTEERNSLRNKIRTQK
jgi:hypothetical protein